MKDTETIRQRRDRINEFATRIEAIADELGFSSVIFGAIAPIDDHSKHEPPFIAGGSFTGNPEDAMLLTGIVMGRARSAIWNHATDLAHFRVNQGKIGAESIEGGGELVDYMHDIPEKCDHSDVTHSKSKFIGSIQCPHCLLWLVNPDWCKAKVI